MCVATDLNNGSRLQIRMNFDKAYILVETAESYVRILIMIATWGAIEWRLNCSTTMTSCLTRTFSSSMVLRSLLCVVDQMWMFEGKVPIFIATVRRNC